MTEKHEKKNNKVKISQCGDLVFSVTYGRLLVFMGFTN